MTIINQGGGEGYGYFVWVKKMSGGVIFYLTKRKNCVTILVQERRKNE